MMKHVSLEITESPLFDSWFISNPCVIQAFDKTPFFALNNRSTPLRCINGYRMRTVYLICDELASRVGLFKAGLS